MKKMTRVFLVILALVFVFTSIGLANAEVLQIKPKGDKKIKIGVMDLISSIEVAALFNKRYQKWSKDRGWDCQIFDLNFNFAQSGPVMENMISAGYDGIIVNWTAPKLYEKQIKKAFDQGIPVIIVAGFDMVPGLIADFVAWNSAMGGMTAEYLSGRLKRGDKIIAYYYSTITASISRFRIAKTVFDAYGIEIVQELSPTPGKDPAQDAYDSITNALLSDTKKEIKGIWALSDSHGPAAARAAGDLGRKDVIVVTADDSPRTYEALRTLPNLQAVVGYNGNAHVFMDDMFKIFEKVFAGEPVETHQYRGLDCYLVTKRSIPPRGYFYSTRGYEGRPKDY
jgi:ABC-type sugar transport system substrate-binding protein